ncbi:MAG: ankyrin repeat domain-containing protein [Alphaproteobacteria bacterium GM202ARS2]|nr:ankyrin repeat domain-containing protein [Alphaproteobacteria bacterium GM202ARS2]
MVIPSGLRAVLLKQADGLRGGATRLDFAWWSLFVAVCLPLAFVVDPLRYLYDKPFLAVCVALAFFLPNLAIFVRRLRGLRFMGVSAGWWLFIYVLFALVVIDVAVILANHAAWTQKSFVIAFKYAVLALVVVSMLWFMLGVWAFAGIMVALRHLDYVLTREAGGVGDVVLGLFLDKHYPLYVQGAQMLFGERWQSWFWSFMLATLLVGVFVVASVGGCSVGGDKPCAELCDIHRMKQATVNDVLSYIRLGSDLGARDYKGHTPLHIVAGYNDNPRVVEVLLEAGADTDARDRHGHTPLHGAAKLSGNPEVVHTLVEGGLDLEARDIWGLTPLHIAARDNDAPVIILALLEAGADAGARTEAGATAFDFIKKNKDLKDTSAYWRLRELSYQ